MSEEPDYLDEDDAYPSKTKPRPTVREATQNILLNRVMELEQELAKVKNEIKQNTLPVLELWAYRNNSGGCFYVKDEGYIRRGHSLRGYRLIAVPIARTDLIEKLGAVLQAYKE